MNLTAPYTQTEIDTIAQPWTIPSFDRLNELHAKAIDSLEAEGAGPDGQPLDAIEECED